VSRFGTHVRTVTRNCSLAGFHGICTCCVNVAINNAPYALIDVPMLQPTSTHQSTLCNVGGRWYRGGRRGGVRQGREQGKQEKDGTEVSDLHLSPPTQKTDLRTDTQAPNILQYLFHATTSRTCKKIALKSPKSHPPVPLCCHSKHQHQTDAQVPSPPPFSVDNRAPHRRNTGPAVEVRQIYGYDRIFTAVNRTVPVSTAVVRVIYPNREC
jgi:hypothetical protein